MEWSTQTPAGVTVVGFIVDSQVGFSNGSKTVLSGNAGPTANSIALKFTSPNGASTVVGLTKITTRFTAPNPTTVTSIREFALNTNAFQGGVGSGGQPPPDRPVVQISGAKAIDRSDFEARWNVQAAKDVTVIRFRVIGEITYGSRLKGDLIPIEGRF